MTGSASEPRYESHHKAQAQEENMNQNSPGNRRTIDDVLREYFIRLSLSNWEIVFYVAILIAALATRLYSLGSRVVSHDEVLHTQYSYQYAIGDGYRHSPLMHGPFLFHVTALGYLFLGADDLTSRIPVALLGILLVLAPLFLRDLLGKKGAAVASLFLLASPFLTYYSRYIRHDVPFILFALIAFLAAFRYWRLRSNKHLYVLSAALALMFSTKETAYIAAAIMILLFLATLTTKVLRASWFRQALSRSRLLFLLLSLSLLGMAASGGARFFSDSVSANGTIAADDGQDVGFAVDPESDQPAANAEEGSPYDSAYGWLFAVSFSLALLTLWLLLRKHRTRLSGFSEFDLLILLATLVLPLGTAFVVSASGGAPMDYAVNLCQVEGQETMSAISLLAGRIGNSQCRTAFLSSPILGTSATLILLLAASTALGLWWDKRRWLKAAAIFHVIFFLLHTSLLSNPEGWTSGMVGSLGYWLEQQGERRGDQPYYYYLLLAPMYEYLIAALSLLSLRQWLKKAGAFTVARIGTITVLVAVIAASFVSWRSEMAAESPELAMTWPAAATAGVILLAGLLWLYFSQSGFRRQDTAASGKPTLSEGDIFAGIMIWWLLLTLLALSVAGEKMPWLSTHFVVPMALLSGWYLNGLFSRLRDKGTILTLLPNLLLITAALLISMVALSPILRGAVSFRDQDTVNLVAVGRAIGAVLMALLLAIFAHRRLADLDAPQKRAMWVSAAALLLLMLTFRTNFMASFQNEDLATEHLVYAHGAPSTKADVMPQIERLSMRLYGDKSIRVSYDDDASWPYTWYLRDYPNRHFYAGNPDGTLTESPVIIAGSYNWDKVEPILQDDYVERRYTFLWWPLEDYRNLSWESFLGDPRLERAERRSLLDAEVRGALWDIFFHRDYAEYGLASSRDLGLGNWPLRHDLKLYLRKDVLANLWDYGVNVAAVTPPVDPYEAGDLALEPALIIGSAGSGQGQFSSPRNVAVSEDGQIYVLDSGNNRVQLFHPDGSFLGQWGSFGTGDGQFNEPWGIAVGPERLYVADTWNHRIQVFDRDGHYLFQFGQSSVSFTDAEPGSFYGPREIALLNDGRLAVSDTGHHRIQVFDEDGHFISQFGSQGFGVGNFSEPVGLAESRSSELFIADTWNSRVQSFDLNGRPIDSWVLDAWKGNSVNNKPFLAVDSYERLYVSDPEGYRILIFDRDGQYLGRSGSYGVGPQNFNLPTGIAIGPGDSIYVVDSGNNRILRFDAPGNLAPIVIPSE